MSSNQISYQWFIEDSYFGTAVITPPWLDPRFHVVSEHFFCRDCGRIYAQCLADYNRPLHTISHGRCRNCTSRAGFHFQMPGSVVHQWDRFFDWDKYPLEVLKYEFLVRYNHCRRYKIL